MVSAGEPPDPHDLSFVVAHDTLLTGVQGDEVCPSSFLALIQHRPRDDEYCVGGRLRKTFDLVVCQLDDCYAVDRGDDLRRGLVDVNHGGF